MDEPLGEVKQRVEEHTGPRSALEAIPLIRWVDSRLVEVWDVSGSVERS
jgi:hypothetical protein